MTTPPSSGSDHPGQDRRPWDAPAPDAPPPDTPPPDTPPRDAGPYAGPWQDFGPPPGYDSGAYTPGQPPPGYQGGYQQGGYQGHGPGGGQQGYGQAPPGYPGYPGSGYPGSGYPGYPAPPVNPGVNGFSIASLVLGLVSCIPLGLIFGIVALVQIKRTGRRGRGMAIAGIALSCVWVVAIVALVVVGVVNSAQRNAAGQIIHSGQLDESSLRVGDCFNKKLGTATSFVEGVPCAQPHDAEVFAVFQSTDAAWPGHAQMQQEAEHGCLTRVQTYLGIQSPPLTLRVSYLYPQQKSWAIGDRRVICDFRDTGGKRTGSIGSGSS